MSAGIRPTAVGKFANRVRYQPDGPEELGEPPWDKEHRRTWRPARPHSREDIMLDLRFNNGCRRSFAYSYLTGIEWDGEVISLSFATEIVTIRGRNLLRLYEALVQHRVPYVQQGSEAEEALRSQNETHVEAIEIKEVATEHEHGNGSHNQ
jgi:hypothetical protein